jgi:hypothetical protein
MQVEISSYKRFMIELMHIRFAILSAVLVGALCNAQLPATIPA